MSKKSSSSSPSLKLRNSDDRTNHGINVEHEDVANEGVSTDVKAKQIVEVQSLPEETKYIAPSGSKRPNPKTSLPMSEQLVKERNPQMAFDFNCKNSNEVIETQLNMENRDQNEMNKDLKITFLDIFAEPGPQYHSVACVWTTSYRVFEITRIYGYKILTLILGLPVAFLAGFVFALFTFSRIWIMQPIFAIVRITLEQILTLWATALIYIVRPFFYSVGAVFSTFRLYRSDGPIIREIWENV